MSMIRIMIPVMVLIATLLLIVPLCGGARRTADFEKRTMYEQRCKDIWWQCRQRAARKKEKDRDRVMKICQTQFVSCMQKCQRYE